MPVSTSRRGDFSAAAAKCIHRFTQSGSLHDVDFEGHNWPDCPYRREPINEM